MHMGRVVLVHERLLCTAVTPADATADQGNTGNANHSVGRLSGSDSPVSSRTGIA
jgi:hypothetical protein